MSQLQPNGINRPCPPIRYRFKMVPFWQTVRGIRWSSIHSSKESHGSERKKKPTSSKVSGWDQKQSTGSWKLQLSMATQQWSKIWAIALMPYSCPSLPGLLSSRAKTRSWSSPARTWPWTRSSSYSCKQNCPIPTTHQKFKPKLLLLTLPSPKMVSGISCCIWLFKGKDPI